MTQLATGATRQRIDVAVAVVFNAAGDVLWACRPQGKAYAGYWEFPGGKVEPGESVWQALVRELQEELAITCLAGGPWFRIEHDYEHAHVRLHLYRVWSFTGEPKAMEQQRFTWAPLNSLDPLKPNLSPILPATEPLLPKLAQPGFMALSNYGQGFEACAARLESALLGATQPFYIQFREKTLEGNDLLKAFEHAQSLCAGTAHTLVVNSACLGSLERASGKSIAHSLHLTEHHLQQPLAFQGRALAGASVHSLESLHKAFELDLKYAVLGAVRETTSHVGQAGMGWSAFRQVAEQARLPVYAIGGLHVGDLGDAMHHGAHGVAMLSRIQPSN